MESKFVELDNRRIEIDDFRPPKAPFASPTPDPSAGSSQRSEPLFGGVEKQRQEIEAKARFQK